MPLDSGKSARSEHGLPTESTEKPSSGLGKNLALALVSTTLALLVVEGIARVAHHLRAGGKGGGEQARYLEHDPLLGWRKRPGARVTYRRREYTVEVPVSSLGLRGKERAYLPERRAFRIIALGDSFVEGNSVRQNETLTEVLERELRSPNGPIEVLNGGTAGYSTDQEYLFYLEEGSRYAPQVVLLFFYYNDVLFNARTRYFSSPKPHLEVPGSHLVVSNDPVPRRPRQRPQPGKRARAPIVGSAAFSWMAERLQVGAPRAFNALAALGLWEPTGGEEPHEQMLVYKRRWHAEIERGWDLTGKILRALDQEVRARGSRWSTHPIAWR